VIAIGNSIPSLGCIEANARAIQQPALEIWNGQDKNVLSAQEALKHRANCNRAARRGEYNFKMERI